MIDGLPDADRREVLAATQRRRYARREVIFHEEDPADALHLIDKGRVAVRITTPLGDVATLNILGPGDVIGELALLDDGARRNATVIAIERTETLVMRRDQFAALRAQHPALDRFITAVLAAEVSRVSRLLVEALYAPADLRVVRRLVDLVDLYNEDGTSSSTEIPLTQEDLASLAGTSRATVNRVLGELEAAGALDVARGRITVTGIDVLTRKAR